ncbi:MAG: hypothetical protein ACLFTK_14745 [Anaerolineales bacterium]
MRIIPFLLLLLLLLAPLSALAQDDPAPEDKSEAEERAEAVAAVELTQEFTLADGAITLQIPPDWITFPQDPAIFIARDTASLERLVGAIENVFDNIQQELDPDATPRPTPTPPPVASYVVGVGTVQELDLFALGYSYEDELTIEDIRAGMDIPQDVESEPTFIETEIDGHPALIVIIDQPELGEQDVPAEWFTRSISAVVLYPTHALTIIGLVVAPQDDTIIFEAIARSAQADPDALAAWGPDGTSPDAIPEPTSDMLPTAVPLTPTP